MRRREAGEKDLFPFAARSNHRIEASASIGQGSACSEGEDHRYEYD